jgi:hypothetical protein
MTVTESNFKPRFFSVLFIVFFNLLSRVTSKGEQVSFCTGKSEAAVCAEMVRLYSPVNRGK